jgi:tripartite-type tricarboxylate transporter receptor subunit TctC
MFYFRKLKENSGTTIAKQKVMETQKVKTCFTITFTQEQYVHAKAYVDDMKKHPQRVFWQGKEKKTDDELVIEQIAHRILSGFYNDDPFNAGRHIMRMDSMVTA